MKKINGEKLWIRVRELEQFKRKKERKIDRDILTDKFTQTQCGVRKALCGIGMDGYA